MEFKEYKWYFPNGCRKNIGINNGNIEMFLDTPIVSLGREICQNSGDARRDKSKPVEVEFKTIKFKTSELPDVDELKYAVDQGELFWKSQNNPKADNFYARAKETLASEYITVLRVSDHNTIGLSGADQPDNTKVPWTALVMSEGASSKDGTGGGSFGIGKFAAFANSKLRTVFYSTLDSTKKEASQGLSILASFFDKSGQKTFGEGYCGALNGDESSPIFKQISFDEAYIRDGDDYGTDIYILGFLDNADWKTQMIAAVLDGFMYAIDQNMMIVTVDDVQISQKTLDQVMEKYQRYCKDVTVDYYQVLRSDAKWIDFDDYDGNKNCMHLKLLVVPGLHKRVAMVRQTGMKIFDRDHINGQISFAGFLYIDGENANKYLTSLENPAHIAWLVARDPNEKHATNYLAHINRVIRKELEKLIDQNFGGEISLQMDNMLQSTDKDPGDKEKQDVLTDETTEIKTRKRDMSSQDEETKYSDDAGEGQGENGSEGGKDHGTDGEGGSGTGYGGGTGGTGEGGSGTNGSGDSQKEHEVGRSDKVKAVTLSTRRLQALNPENGEYRFILKAKETCENATVEIGISAEDAVYTPSILKIKVDGQPNVTVSGNKLNGVKLTDTDKVFINLKIEDSTDYTSFEVRVYEVKAE